MFDIGWQELFIVAVLTVIVIGPKDLPRTLRAVVGLVRKGRTMAREFQDGVDDMVREADLDDIKKQLEKPEDFELGKAFEEPLGLETDVAKEVGDIEADIAKELDVGDIEADLGKPADTPAGLPAVTEPVLTEPAPKKAAQRKSPAARARKTTTAKAAPKKAKKQTVKAPPAKPPPAKAGATGTAARRKSPAARARPARPAPVARG